MGTEMLAYAAVAAAAVAAAGTAYTAKTSSDTMEAQANTDQMRAVQNQQLAQTKATEEQAAAQRAAGEDVRTARLAQSRLGAVAGGSGSGASDPTIQNLWAGIEQEGRRNADADMAVGAQRAQGINYQSALDRWSADSNAAIKRSAASNTAIGGYISAAGQFGSGATSGMAMRYNAPRMQTSSTGYSNRIY